MKFRAGKVCICLSFHLCWELVVDLIVSVPELTYLLSKDEKSVTDNHNIKSSKFAANIKEKLSYRFLI